MVIWRFVDGKSGHENQSLGLVNALGRLTKIELVNVDVQQGNIGTILDWVFRRFPPGNDLPRPFFIVGAGHHTHIPMLAAKRSFGGKLIVLMKPTLPLSWFDCCIVPQHDGVELRENIIQTQGVLNVVEASDQQSPRRGLMLIGGPSKHHLWDENKIIEQVVAVVNKDPDVSWSLSTSRRTPKATSQRLIALSLSNLKVFVCTATPPQWVAEQLRWSGQVWVSEDSVSMVYETLTSGARVGVFNVPAKKAGRVVAGVNNLIEKKWVTSFRVWVETGCKLGAPEIKFNEADECAKKLLLKWVSE